VINELVKIKKEYYYLFKYH